MRTTQSGSSPSFLADTLTYANRVKLFSRTDWIVYVAWVGMMFGLLFSVSAFFLVGYVNGVSYPPYVW
ncbi:MAG: hypothetical protein EOP11_27010, partial [Proteobacteria bacterium]